MTGLEKTITDEIKAAGPVTFARFMELALYHPEQGYYASGRAAIGRSGDFYTSPHTGPVFGRLIYETFHKMSGRLSPGPASFVEMGAGEGYLAKDFIEAMKGRGGDYRYIIVENSGGMRAKQENTLGVLAPMVTWYGSVEEIPGPVNGVFFSNELVDAFPFHRVCQCRDALKEMYINICADGCLCEEMGALSTPDIPRHLNRIGVRLPAGVTTEVCLGASGWMRSVAGKLARGFVVTVDYGYTSEEYYMPERTRGTMMCYRRHAANEEPLLRVGGQDITAHVDFSSLALSGSEAGLTPVLYTDQTSFLMEAACGLEAALKGGPGAQEELENLGMGLKPLVHPEWMGGAFKVLVQSKGVDASGLYVMAKDRTRELLRRRAGGSFTLS